MNNVQSIRNLFKRQLDLNNLADNGTLEIINASFIADEVSIFGKLNEEYAKKELDWYESQCLSIDGLEPNVPAIWRDIASDAGLINSNYGWCIYSEENNYQFGHAIKALLDDKHSRQASMIYNRPSMHQDATADGMKDFMCTYSVQLLIRDNTLYYLVYMRSNDAVFGYKNDRYWHDHVFNKAFDALVGKYSSLKKGTLYWNVASLHVYPRHFYLVEQWTE